MLSLSLSESSYFGFTTAKGNSLNGFFSGFAKAFLKKCWAGTLLFIWLVQKKKNRLMKLVTLKNICRTGPPWKSRKQMYTEVWLLKLLLNKFLHQGRGILCCAWTHQSPAFYFTRPKLQGFMYKRAAKVWTVYNYKVATQRMPLNTESFHLGLGQCLKG